MQKMQLNNWSVDEANIHIWDINDLRGHVDRRRRFRLCDDCNNDAVVENWPKQEDVNVHAPLYQLLKCEVKQTKD